MFQPQSLLRRVVPFLLALPLAACAPGQDTDELEAAEATEKPFSSARATLLEVEFDGELSAVTQTNTNKLIKDQLFYLVGQLNAHDSVARLDKVVLTKVKKTPTSDGWMKVTYHAKLPIGWGAKDQIPSSLSFTLPRKIGPQSLTSFMTKYAPTCSDDGAHNVTSGNYWYHFRPEADSCSLDAADAVTSTGTVRVSPVNTSGKYPEYHRVWEDGTLRVIAVFGKYEDGATGNDDAGIASYNAFVSAMNEKFGEDVATTPANVGDAPGVSAPDITWTGNVNGDADRKLSVTALLIDSPKVATQTFKTRYKTLTRTTDIVAYNGHAGLGANVKALGVMGDFAPGRYTMFFLNGCDTFAYLDETLWGRFVKMNANDPQGTKHLDVLTNLMPAYFHQMPTASMALITAMSDPADPRTFDQIFTGIDQKQVVVVMGEEDNEYDPKPAAFDGLSLSGTVERGASATAETPLLPAGEYTIATEGTGSADGDVDLYVGIGRAPTTDLYDRRPFLYGSDEEVTIRLTAPTKLYMMVHGYEDSAEALNHFRLTVE